PAFSIHTSTPSAETPRTAPNSSPPSETNAWNPTSICCVMSITSWESSLEQLRVEVNLRSRESLRDGAVPLRVQRVLLERRIVDARNLRLGRQRHLRDGEGVPDLLQRVLAAVWMRVGVMRARASWAVSAIVKHPGMGRAD